MTDFMNYDVFTKNQWRDFYQAASVPLTQASLKQIKAFNDQISVQDVQDIYIPLIHYLGLLIKHFDQWQNSKAAFLRQPTRHVPYIIGIAGSVAVGKSTTARLLKVLMNHFFLRTSELKWSPRMVFFVLNVWTETKRLVGTQGVSWKLWYEGPD